MKPYAFITARGGSKRIPKKNIRDFCGKPIIAYSIEAALVSGLFEDVVVSTDSYEIADVAVKYGASVPFMRSDKNSDDYADTADVLIEIIDNYDKKGVFFDEFCCIYPTAPFITADKLCISHDMLKDNNVYNVVSMLQYSFPPQRGMEVTTEGFLKPINDVAIEKRSQDLSPIYHDCGQFYWVKTDHFRNNRNILSNHTLPFLVPDIEAQDIDTESDWHIAEIKYRMLNAVK